MIFRAGLLVCLAVCLLGAAWMPEASQAAPEALGTMRVFNCKEYVSLREKPAQNSERLEKVPLGALVYDCVRSEKGFIYCQYEGTYGYILSKYLEVVTGAEAAIESSESGKMTLDEILSSGETILDWSEYNVRVVASRDSNPNDSSVNEVLRVGCFIDEDPVWGFTTSAGEIGQFSVLKAFMGGTAMEPQVMVYNGAYGLRMLDLLSGKEIWTLSSGEYSLGNAAAVAVSDDGIMYIAGTDGPPPTAVSTSGKVLWTAQINDPDVYWPNEIDLEMDEIRVKYESGKMVVLEYNGDVIAITDLP